MRITEHFTRFEFDCRDGTSYPEEWMESRLRPLCEALEKIRERAGGPLNITSGYRTKIHNERQGGKPKSKHLIGIAADIVSRNLSARRLGKLIQQLIDEGEIPDGGFKIYPSFVHYDQRGRKARW